MAYE